MVNAAYHRQYAGIPFRRWGEICVAGIALGLWLSAQVSPPFGSLVLPSALCGSLEATLELQCGKLSNAMQNLSRRPLALSFTFVWCCQLLAWSCSLQLAHSLHLGEKGYLLRVCRSMEALAAVGTCEYSSRAAKLKQRSPGARDDCATTHVPKIS